MDKGMMTRREIIKAIIENVARQHLMSYKTLTEGTTQSAWRARKEAIIKVSEAFPMMSSVHLGNVFSRHHTTILYSLGRLSRVYQKKVAA